MDLLFYIMLGIGVVWLAYRTLKYLHPRTGLPKDWDVKFWADFEKWREDPTNRVGH